MVVPGPRSVSTAPSVASVGSKPFSKPVSAKQATAVLDSVSELMVAAGAEEAVAGDATIVPSKKKAESKKEHPSVSSDDLSGTNQEAAAQAGDVSSGVDDAKRLKKQASKESSSVTSDTAKEGAAAGTVDLSEADGVTAKNKKKKALAAGKSAVQAKLEDPSGAGSMSIDDDTGAELDSNGMPDVMTEVGDDDTDSEPGIDGQLGGFPGSMKDLLAADEGDTAALSRPEKKSVGFADEVSGGSLEEVREFDSVEGRHRLIYSMLGIKGPGDSDAIHLKSDLIDLFATYSEKELAAFSRFCVDAMLDFSSCQTLEEFQGKVLAESFINASLKSETSKVILKPFFDSVQDVEHDYQTLSQVYLEGLMVLVRGDNPELARHEDGSEQGSVVKGVSFSTASTASTASTVSKPPVKSPKSILKKPSVSSSERHAYSPFEGVDMQLSAVDPADTTFEELDRLLNGTALQRSLAQIKDVGVFLAIKKGLKVCMVLCNELHQDGLDLMGHIFDVLTGESKMEDILVDVAAKGAGQALLGPHLLALYKQMKFMKGLYNAVHQEQQKISYKAVEEQRQGLDGVSSRTVYVSKKKGVVSVRSQASLSRKSALSITEKTFRLSSLDMKERLKIYLKTDELQIFSGEYKISDQEAKAVYDFLLQQHLITQDSEDGPYLMSQDRLSQLKGSRHYRDELKACFSAHADKKMDLVLDELESRVASEVGGREVDVALPTPSEALDLSEVESVLPEALFRSLKPEGMSNDAFRSAVQASAHEDKGLLDFATRTRRDLKGRLIEQGLPDPDKGRFGKFFTSSLATLATLFKAPYSYYFGEKKDVDAHVDSIRSKYQWFHNDLSGRLDTMTPTTTLQSRRKELSVKEVKVHDQAQKVVSTATHSLGDKVKAFMAGDKNPRTYEDICNEFDTFVSDKEASLAKAYGLSTSDFVKAMKSKVGMDVADTDVLNEAFSNWMQVQEKVQVFRAQVCQACIDELLESNDGENKDLKASLNSLKQQFKLEKGFSLSEKEKTTLRSKQGREFEKAFKELENSKLKKLRDHKQVLDELPDSASFSESDNLDLMPDDAELYDSLVRDIRLQSKHFLAASSKEFVELAASKGLDASTIKGYDRQVLDLLNMETQSFTDLYQQLSAADISSDDMAAFRSRCIELGVLLSRPGLGSIFGGTVTFSRDPIDALKQLEQCQRQLASVPVNNPLRLENGAVLDSLQSEIRSLMDDIRMDMSDTTRSKFSPLAGMLKMSVKTFHALSQKDFSTLTSDEQAQWGQAVQDLASLKQQLLADCVAGLAQGMDISGYQSSLGQVSDMLDSVYFKHDKAFASLNLDLTVSSMDALASYLMTSPDLSNLTDSHIQVLQAFIYSPTSFTSARHFSQIQDSLSSICPELLQHLMPIMGIAKEQSDEIVLQLEGGSYLLADQHVFEDRMIVTMFDQSTMQRIHVSLMDPSRIRAGMFDDSVMPSLIRSSSLSLLPEELGSSLEQKMSDLVTEGLDTTQQQALYDKLKSGTLQEKQQFMSELQSYKPVDSQALQESMMATRIFLSQAASIYRSQKEDLASFSERFQPVTVEFLSSNGVSKKEAEFVYDALQKEGVLSEHGYLLCEQSHLARILGLVEQSGVISEFKKEVGLLSRGITDEKRRLLHRLLFDHCCLSDSKRQTIETNLRSVVGDMMEVDRARVAAFSKESTFSGDMRDTFSTFKQLQTAHVKAVEAANIEGSLQAIDQAKAMSRLVYEEAVAALSLKSEVFDTVIPLMSDSLQGLYKSYSEHCEKVQTLQKELSVSYSFEKEKALVLAVKQAEVLLTELTSGIEGSQDSIFSQEGLKDFCISFLSSKQQILSDRLRLSQFSHFDSAFFEETYAAHVSSYMLAYHAMSKVLKPSGAITDLEVVSLHQRVQNSFTDATRSVLKQADAAVLPDSIQGALRDCYMDLQRVSLKELSKTEAVFVQQLCQGLETFMDQKAYFDSSFLADMQQAAVVSSQKVQAQMKSGSRLLQGASLKPLQGLLLRYQKSGAVRDLEVLHESLLSQLDRVPNSFLKQVDELSSQPFSYLELKAFFRELKKKDQDGNRISLGSSAFKFSSDTAIKLLTGHMMGQLEGKALQAFDQRYKMAFIHFFPDQSADFINFEYDQRFSKISGSSQGVVSVTKKQVSDSQSETSPVSSNESDFQLSDTSACSAVITSYSPSASSISLQSCSLSPSGNHRLELRGGEQGKDSFSFQLKSPLLLKRDKSGTSLDPASFKSRPGKTSAFMQTMLESIPKEQHAAAKLFLKQFKTPADYVTFYNKVQHSLGQVTPLSFVTPGLSVEDSSQIYNRLEAEGIIKASKFVLGAALLPEKNLIAESLTQAFNKEPKILLTDSFDYIVKVVFGALEHPSYTSADTDIPEDVLAKRKDLSEEPQFVRGYPRFESAMTLALFKQHNLQALSSLYARMESANPIVTMLEKIDSRHTSLRAYGDLLTQFHAFKLSLTDGASLDSTALETVLHDLTTQSEKIMMDLNATLLTSIETFNTRETTCPTLVLSEDGSDILPENISSDSFMTQFRSFYEHVDMTEANLRVFMDELASGLADGALSLSSSDWVLILTSIDEDFQDTFSEQLSLSMCRSFNVLQGDDFHYDAESFEIFSAFLSSDEMRATNFYFESSCLDSLASAMLEETDYRREIALTSVELAGLNFLDSTSINASSLLSLSGVEALQRNVSIVCDNKGELDTFLSGFSAEIKDGLSKDDLMDCSEGAKDLLEMFLEDSVDFSRLALTLDSQGMLLFKMNEHSFTLNSLQELYLNVVEKLFPESTDVPEFNDLPFVNSIIDLQAAFTAGQAKDLCLRRLVHDSGLPEVLASTGVFSEYVDTHFMSTDSNNYVQLDSFQTLYQSFKTSEDLHSEDAQRLFEHCDKALSLLGLVDCMDEKITDVLTLKAELDLLRDSADAFDQFLVSIFSDECQFDFIYKLDIQVKVAMNRRSKLEAQAVLAGSSEDEGVSDASSTLTEAASVDTAVEAVSSEQASESVEESATAVNETESGEPEDLGT